MRDGPQVVPVAAGQTWMPQAFVILRERPPGCFTTHILWGNRYLQVTIIVFVSVKVFSLPMIVMYNKVYNFIPMMYNVKNLSDNDSIVIENYSIFVPYRCIIILF